MVREKSNTHLPAKYADADGSLASPHGTVKASVKHTTSALDIGLMAALKRWRGPRARLRPVYPPTFPPRLDGEFYVGVGLALPTHLLRGFRSSTIPDDTCGAGISPAAIRQLPSAPPSGPDRQR
jgi:hypothetical protein